MAERPNPIDDVVANCARRMSALADSGIALAIDEEFRAAAVSVARQAAGAWTGEATDGAGFRLRTHDRTAVFAKSFGRQFLAVVDGLRASRIPELRAIIEKIGGSEDDAPITGAFFTLFAAHELLHVEQGLGSDQYTDTDHYAAAVMQADYVADISGLAICLEARIDELAALSGHEKALLLVAIHLLSMHSFVEDRETMDADTFHRLSIWYLHLARIHKATECPDLAAPSFARPWVVMFPRLVGGADREVTGGLLDERAHSPIAAKSDVVLAYHRDDRLFRLHRVLLTAEDRAVRLCRAILGARIDDVRAELEEILVEHPALVPGGNAASHDLEWHVAATMVALEALREAASSRDPEALEVALDIAHSAAARLPGAVARGSVSVDRKDQLAAITDGLERIEQALGTEELWSVTRQAVRRLYLPLDRLREPNGNLDR